MDNKTLSDLIGLIYDAAFDSSLWPRLLRSLSDELEPLILDLSSDPSFERPDNAIQFPNSPFFETSGTPLRCCELEETAAWVIRSDGGLRAKTPEPAAQVPKTVLFKLLHSHFLRALELNRRIFEGRDEHHALKILFERLPLGIVIVDGHCRVLTHNRKLEQIVSDQKGFIIKNNLLGAVSEADTRHIRQVIDGVTAAGNNEIRTIHLSPSDSGMPMSALAVPFAGNAFQDESGKNRALVIVAAPEIHAQISHETLSSLYNLTSAEARLVSSLVNDRCLADIADDFGTSKHTIRNQLKSIYEKTGTHRQAELVRQIITGPAMLATLSEDQTPGCPNQNSTIPTPYDQTIMLPDGRRLGYAEYGARDGQPVMLMHAANGSRLERHPNEKIIKQCGVRLIVPERPGVGLSDSRPRVTLFNWAQDVAYLADHLKLEKFNIIGHSLGAAFGMACAYKLKERIGRIVTVAGIAPFDSFWELDGMYLPFRLVLTLGRYAFNLIEPAVKLFNRQFDLTTASKNLFQNLPPVDRALVSDPRIKDRIMENIMENARRGEHTTLQEAFIVSRHWGFDIRRIAIPVEIWHGEQDNLIPKQMALNLSQKLPNCRTHFLPGAGHYLLFHCWKEILLSAVSQESFQKKSLYSPNGSCQTLVN